MQKQAIAVSGKLDPTQAGLKSQRSPEPLAQIAGTYPMWAAACDERSGLWSRTNSFSSPVPQQTSHTPKLFRPRITPELSRTGCGKFRRRYQRGRSEAMQPRSGVGLNDLLGCSLRGMRADSHRRWTPGLPAPTRSRPNRQNNPSEKRRDAGPQSTLCGACVAPLFYHAIWTSDSRSTPTLRVRKPVPPCPLPPVAEHCGAAA